MNENDRDGVDAHHALDGMERRIRWRRRAVLDRVGFGGPNGWPRAGARRQGVADGGTAARIGTVAFCWTVDMRFVGKTLINNWL